MSHRLGELTHDIRSKVTAILLGASLIHEGKAGPLTGRQVEISGLIIEQAEELHLALQEMITLVRPA
ncbi:MAG: hypothetical protein JWM80_3812 [Cyanobacteria bacterium RYN_339]|nr:hypothetical protein [Cyanobacteria bacterium RYN_339]